MNLTHIRTENGIATPITTRAALDEINAGMMDKAIKRTIRSMSAAHSNANIEYRDGRKVTIKLATPEQIAEIAAPKPETTTTIGRRMPAGSRIVTAKGKRYVVSPIRPARPRTPGATSWTPEAYISYWAERNGRDTGATHSATASGKPGTVGAAIWEAANNTNN